MSNPKKSTKSAAPAPATAEKPTDDKDAKAAKKTPVKKRSGRRPGRPRKNVKKKEMEKLGIVKEPLNKDCVDTRLRHVMELRYDNPDLFKRIFTVFKSMGTQRVNMEFQEKRINIIGRDFQGKSDIFVEIFCDRVHRYYCKKPYTIGLSVEKFLTILQTLKKDYDEVLITSPSETQRSKIHAVFHHATVDELTVHKPDVSKVLVIDSETIRAELDAEDTYPLSFTLEAKYFKEKVSAWGKLGDVISIEQAQGGKLKIVQKYRDNDGDDSTLYRNSKNINLVSRIEELGIPLFSVSVKLPNIRPIANSQVSDKIKISAGEVDRLIFTIVLDQEEDLENKGFKPGTEVCRIKILTDIINFNDDNEKKNEDASASADESEDYLSTDPSAEGDSSEE